MKSGGLPIVQGGCHTQFQDDEHLIGCPLDVEGIDAEDGRVDPEWESFLEMSDAECARLKIQKKERAPT